MANKGQHVRVASIGECMIELRHSGPSQLTLAYGGDTLNTAVYLARLGEGQGIEVSYLTALGDDPYSDAMIEFWRAEGIRTDRVVRLAGRVPGLYAIRTDDRGERSFYYWRSAAAARDMMKGPQAAAIADGLGGFDWIYLSGVTLSILDQSSRQALIEAVAAARRRGVRIAFDSNYRPRGWSSAEEARRWFAEMWRTTDVALPGLADERAVFGDADGSAVARRLRAQGAVEVAVKDAEQPCLVAVADAEHTVTAESVPTPVDTTAAGDSFNAAYIAARIGGLDPASGARCGHRLAARVIQHPGAVIPRHLMPKDVIR